MKKGGGRMSDAAKTAAGGGAKEQHHEGEARPPKQYTAEQLALFDALLEECLRYAAMEEEDVLEEYRRAGKLHTYDEDKEWQKRLARVVKLHPGAWPKHMVARIERYITYLEEDEDDYRIGLYSLIEDEIRD